MTEEKELQSKKLHPEELLLSWEAPDFEDHERNASWYVAAGAFALALFAYSIYTSDWFFAVVVVALVIVTFKYLKISPKTNTYGISRVGIQVNEKLYSYDQLHSFWIVYQPPTKVLNVLTTRRYMPQLSMQLVDQDPVMIKKILKKFMPEQEKRGENPIDKVTRMLKF